MIAHVNENIIVYLYIVEFAEVDYHG
ncbi:hypothetical protein SPV1_10259 [Mariprofundus ferrooxydans PV-1]|uniref:Uncharacterized protein n=1 Tax=Mariprofundus ferrooxydans PV-1 TaxID=314345 RepID=Q0EWU9_9PROT|nr:hypothetical protein SPV1_10259 [Mariprofundus ferrooxydans PV-1]